MIPCFLWEPRCSVLLGSTQSTLGSSLWAGFCLSETGRPVAHSACFHACQEFSICLWNPESSKASDWLSVQFDILVSIATRAGHSWGKGRAVGDRPGVYPFKRHSSCTGDRLWCIVLCAPRSNLPHQLSPFYWQLAPNHTQSNHWRTRFQRPWLPPASIGLNLEGLQSHGHCVESFCFFSIFCLHSQKVTGPYLQRLQNVKPYPIGIKN